MNDTCAPTAPIRITSRTPWFNWLALLLCAALTFAIVLIATRWGAGLSIDSTRYLKAGAHLDEALGISSESSTDRLTHYPPLFPAVLSAFRFVGADPWTASRWLNASLMALSTILAGLIFIKLGGSRIWPGLWGVTIFAIAPDLLQIHSMVWSEPLYIALMLTAALALLAYLTGRHGIATLLIAAISIGLACLTRYAGVALIAAGALAILLLHDATRAKRLRHASLFAAIASAPLCAWVIYNLLSVGTATHRTIGYHPISNDVLRQMGRTITAWWLPRDIPDAMRIALIVLYIATGVAAVHSLLRRNREAPRETASAASIALLKLLAVFSVVYVLMLFASITFFDNDTPLDERILSPFFVTGLLFNVIALKCVMPRIANFRMLRITIGLSCAALLVAYGLSSWVMLKDAARDGLMWGKRKFTDPALREAVAATQARGALYSNAPRPLAANLGRRVLPLPRRIGDEIAEADREIFDSEVLRLRRQVESGAACVIYFDDEDSRSKMIPESEFAELVRSTRFASGSQWRVYVGRGRK